MRCTTTGTWMFAGTDLSPELEIHLTIALELHRGGSGTSTIEAFGAPEPAYMEDLDLGDALRYGVYEGLAEVDLPIPEGGIWMTFITVCIVPEPVGLSDAAKAQVVRLMQACTRALVATAWKGLDEFERA